MGVVVEVRPVYPRGDFGIARIPTGSRRNSTQDCLRHEDGFVCLMTPDEALPLGYARLSAPRDQPR
jgi:hypothetical protein